MERLEELSKDEETKDVAREFQELLLLISYLGTCGQRREVVVFMTIDVCFYILLMLQNWYWSEPRKHYLYHPPKEKTFRGGVEGIVMPAYYGNLCMIWLKQLRAFMKPKRHVLSLWVNCNGTVARMLIEVIGLIVYRGKNHY